MVVDDTPESLRLLADLLISEGYRVRPTHEPKLALDSAFANPPDLILLDVKMPGIDGFEVCQRLKQDGRTAQLPVIFVSALQNVHDRVRGFAVGGVDFITKPIQREEVLARVSSQLELFRIRRHLEERTRELSEANLKLKELDRLKSMFIASMSHELRTPLNSIIGFTGMTLDELSGEINDEQKDNLTRVYKSGRHLLELITDIIDISKIEAGRIDLFPDKFFLADLVDEAVESMQPELKRKGLSLELNLVSGVELYTDKKRLLQCLLNFLSNAVKFTEAGTIAVKIIEFENDVEISVSDSGIGIRQEDIPRLFEAFERLENHLLIKAGGTGLGLYLTKKIATELLHGSVFVKSKPEQGSIFGIRIPRKLNSKPGVPVQKGEKV